MRINGIAATTSIAANSSTLRVAETKTVQSAFTPNKREALENRLNRQQEQIKKLKEEMEQAADNSQGFWNTIGALFGGPVVGTQIGQAIGGYANDGDERATKEVFEVPKHYTGVQLQQGRVALDADWSESESHKTRKKKPD